MQTKTLKYNLKNNIVSAAKCVLAGLLLTGTGIGQVHAQTLPPFKNGDRVAFMGNSITEAGFYESNIWLYYITRFPEQRITIFNAGIGGDVVGHMNNRFEQDILPKKPNIVVLTFGMNDTGYMEFNDANAAELAKQRVEKSYKNFGLLQDKLKARPEITTVMMSSSPYDESMKNKDNYFKDKSKAMAQIVAFQQRAAQQNGWAYVDQFHSMTEINVREQQKNPEFTLTGPDRIHPGKAGHLVMAATFLKSQGLAGKPVASTSIDAVKGLIASDNAKIQMGRKGESGIAFNYLANALPFPIDSVSDVWGNPQKQSDALAVYPFIQEFNQELLQVKRLKKGVYHLMIDGQKIRTFTADSLAKGINMALLSNTPQYQQAIAVMHLNDLRSDLEKKMREYYWLHFNYFSGENMLFKDTETGLEKVLKKAKDDWAVRSKIGAYQTLRFPEVREMWEQNIQQLTEKIYQINQPKSRLIEIVAVK